MKINRFFSEVLGANVKNPRWSWGAVEPIFNRIYLRVWADEIETRGGKEFILLDWDEYFEGYRSKGIKERRDHVERLKTGAEGYGVVCEPTMDGPGRKILGFDSEVLLKLGTPTKRKNRTVAEIVSRVPVIQLKRSQSGSSTTGKDIAQILKSKVETTTKETLVDARVGQGRFRQQVLNQWNRRCAVTGCSIEEVIRASHIKPWRDSTNEERLDPANGLPLIATLDALFDAGLMTFDSGGIAILSDRIPEIEQQNLKLIGMKLAKKPTKETEQYLEYHRSRFGLGLDQ